MRKYVAEFIGTLALVFIGCGAVVVGGPQLGMVGIALAFGLTLMAMAYAVGPISGCHINPAVSLGFFTAGRLSGRELVGYIVSQFLGGIAGTFLLLLMVKAKIGGYDVALNGLGQNGWGLGYLGGYSFTAALLLELIATFLFVLVILRVTRKGGPQEIAGLVIGLTLTAVHLVGLNISGVSVNPARSLGPALFVGGQALAQVWLFLLIPSIAGLLSGLVSRQASVASLERGERSTPRWRERHP